MMRSLKSCQLKTNPMNNFKLLLEEILKTDSFKDLLKDYLAQKISNEYHFRDVEGELIKKEVKTLIVEEAKIAIKELVNEYYELDNIKNLIHKEIQKFSKKELINLINN